MTFLKKRLALNIPIINAQKNSSLLPIQQKNLKRLKDKIIHAKKSIEIEKTEAYKKVLIIDDVLDSGASINEVAKKLIQQKLTTEVYAFTVVANVKQGEFRILKTALIKK